MKSLSKWIGFFWFTKGVGAMVRAVVFDLGGTLMEYGGMGLSWVDYYPAGFQAINEHFGCGADGEAFSRSVEIMRQYNPRVSHRETELAPEYIFEEALAHWPHNPPAAECAEVFFGGLDLKAEIYPDTLPTLKKLRESSIKTAALTDLPNAMPDSLFQKDIGPILAYLDLYVSSASCAFRKPHKHGLQMIAEAFCLPMSQLLFVGDEEKDRQTAENAGCLFSQIHRRQGQRLTSILAPFL